MSKNPLSFEVNIYKVEARKWKRSTTYRLRWKVAGKVFSQPFSTAKLADSFRSDLVTAARKGEPFDRLVGLPNSHMQTQVARTWVDVAREFIDSKWDDAAPRHRHSTAEGLVTLTCALVREGRTPPDAMQLRMALTHWEFNTGARRRLDYPPEEHREALRWIADNSLSMSHLDQAAGVRHALDAIGRKLDGGKASHATFIRKRAALSGALNYAVEKGYLTQNLMPRMKVTRRASTGVVDPRVVVNVAQGRALLEAVDTVDPTLHAFFACLYYAGLRPAEARNLREDDLTLPEEGWGQLMLHKSFQQSGSAWTDDRRSGEERELKHRSEDDSRPVPAHPRLVHALRAHLAEHGTGVGGRLFVSRVGRGGHGGVALPPPYQNPVNLKTVYRVWEAARKEALTPKQYASDLGRTPYDLRHACVSTWLSAGVDATQVARWAGHSVAVLLRVYAACLDDQENAAKRRIDELFGATDGEL